MLHAVQTTTFILFLGTQHVEPSGTKILAFQRDSGGDYSTEEWAEFKGTIPHLNEFTFCWWEKLMFFSVRDSCQWAFCYKNTDDHADHHCTQFWYNRDSASGGRYIIASGGFGDNSYGGKGSSSYQTKRIYTFMAQRL